MIMADNGSTNDSVASFCVYTGFIDERIERYLWHLEDEPKKDVAESLVGDFTFEELDEARIRLFDKAVANVGVERSLNHDGEDIDSDISIANPLRPIKRRSITKVALDICEIYLYITGKVKSFPSGILRRQVMGPSDEYRTKVTVHLEAISERSETDPILHDTVNFPNEPAEVMYDAVRDVAESEESMETTFFSDMSSDTDTGEEGYDNVLESRVETEGTESDSDNPGFWATGAEPWNVPDLRFVQASIPPTVEGEIDRTVVQNETSFVLFAEPHDTSMQCSGASMNPLGELNRGDVSIQPYDVTMSEALSTALATNPIGQDDHFIVQSPEQRKREKVIPEGECTASEADVSALSSISQSSLIKELEEVHERVVLGATRESRKEVVSESVVLPRHGRESAEVLTSVNPRQDPLRVSNTSSVPKVLVEVRREEVVGREAQPSDSIRVGSYRRSITNFPSEQPVGVDTSGTVKVTGENRGNASLINCRSPVKAAGINMSTQTQPNVIPDLPVLKSEFDSSMETMERSLTDHERRVRSNEIWRSRNERKVDKIDAEYHHQMKLLRESNNVMVSDMKSLKNTVKSLSDKIDLFKSILSKDSSASSGIDTPDTKRMRKDSGNVAAAKRGQSRIVSTPARKECTPIKKGVRKRGGGLYRSLLRAARKVISPQGRDPKSSVNPGAIVDDSELPKGVSDTGGAAISVHSALDLRMTAPPIAPEGIRPNRMVASTPVVQNNAKVDLSWAEEDNEDTQAIEFYLSAVEKRGDRREGDESEIIEVDAIDSARTHTDKPASSDSAGKETPRATTMKMAEKQSPSYADSVKTGIGAGGKQSGTIADRGQSAKNAQPSKPAPKTYSKAQNAKNGANGARPKQGNNGQAKGGQGTGQPPHHNNAAGGGQYVKVVTRNGWSTKMVKPRNPSGSVPPLQAGSIRPKKDIFVRGLAATVYSCKDEMEDAVREYCEERGVGVFFMYIMPIQPGSDVANCRIAVAEEDGDTVMQDSFWPEKVTVREWRHSPKDAPPGAGANDNRQNY